ncbi:MAG: addiction module toxin RelE [Novosphingobium sp. SCN 66-18]|nr:MAG: addiction module toxin RelE [Novosphingobium sp. SCN 66-18]
MKLAWTFHARQDRRNIREHIARENPAAALALDEAFTRKAGNLVTHPAVGRPGRVASTRELVVHRNYILIYDAVGDQIRILRVLHARRQWPPFAEITDQTE